MRFYRPLGRISALTFDLDDTLYDNRPVILRTEREALTFVQNYHPALRSFQNEDLQRLRQAVREAEPEIYHDVTRWRFRSQMSYRLNPLQRAHVQAPNGWNYRHRLPRLSLVA